MTNINESTFNWEIILQKWKKQIYSRIKLHETDFPFWYNEAMNVHILTNAMHDCHLYALVESVVDRSNSQKKRKGIADIYYQIANEETIFGYCEAKIMWPENKNSFCDIKSQINAQFEDAERQLKSIQDENISQRMAVVFVVPGWNTFDDCQINYEKLAKSINECAYTFSDYTKIQNINSNNHQMILRGDYKEENNLFFGGCIIIGKEIR